MSSEYLSSSPATRDRAINFLDTLVRNDGSSFDYQALIDAVYNGSVRAIGVGGLAGIGKSTFLDALGTFFAQQDISYSIVHFSDYIQKAREQYAQIDPKFVETKYWTNDIWHSASQLAVADILSQLQKGVVVGFEAIGITMMGINKGESIFDAVTSSRQDVAIYYQVLDPVRIKDTISRRANDRSTSAKPEALLSHLQSMYTELLCQVDKIDQKTLAMLRTTPLPQGVQLLPGENGFARRLAAYNLDNQLAQYHVSFGGILFNPQNNAFV